MGGWHRSAHSTALASGFFLYVGLMEIVAKELVDYHTKGSGLFAVFKLLMLVSGFALMACLGSATSEYGLRESESTRTL